MTRRRATHAPSAPAGGPKSGGGLFHSLRARYYLAVVAMATIPIVVLGLYSAMRSSQELERQSLLLQNELAKRVELEIASFVSARSHELHVLERTSVLDAMSTPAQSASLGRLLAHDQVYQELMVLDRDMQLRGFVSRTAIRPLDGTSWRDAPFARPGYWLRTEAYVGPILYDATLREPLLDVAVPILERRSGTVTAVLLARVRFRQIWDLLADLELPAGTDAFVADASGRILAHRSPARVLSGRVFDLPAEDGRHALADGTPALVTSRALSQVGEPAFVVVTRPLGVALASANETFRRTMLAAGLFLIAASVQALLQARAIVRPVEALAQAARRVSAGDMQARIEASGPEEIETLGRSLDEMLDRLRQAMAKLELSEYVERQRALVTLESIGDAVITADPEGRVTYQNPAASRLTGWPPEAARGRPASEVLDLVQSAPRATAPSPVARCLAEGAFVDTTDGRLLIGRDGRAHAIHTSAAPIRGQDDEILGVVMVFRDVTELKAMEESLRHSQKLDAIGQLTGGIAHDFNNLLQVIQGNAELLVDEPGLDPTLTAPILQATQRGGELTRGLLAFARKQPLQPRPVDVESLLQGMLPLLERTFGETIEITLDVAPGIWSVHADPGQLETALLNLALNARDAMRGGGRLAIRCGNAVDPEFARDVSEGAQEGDFVRIAVSDTGAGMSAETRRRAIDPFFTTKRVGEGSGLGLSMVYGFVMQSGGGLNIDSAAGSGTTVEMYLPRSDHRLACAGGNGPRRIARGHGETVLVVEDDAEVRALARKMLVDLGYRVVQAGTVAGALEAFGGTAGIDLVLTDVVLPGGKSGLDFAKELNAAYPDVPVALMSGYPEAQRVDRGSFAPDTVLLTKPFRRAELAATLRTLLERTVGTGGQAGARHS